jgi:hypothetical protein
MCGKEKREEAEVQKEEIMRLRNMLRDAHILIALVSLRLSYDSLSLLSLISHRAYTLVSLSHMPIDVGC